MRIEEKILKRQGAKHAKGRGDFLTAKGAKEKVFLTTCHEILDLGNAFSVDKIVVTGWGTDGLYPGYTTDYNVYTGLTGSDWTLQLSGTFVDESAQISDRVASTDFAGSKPAIRYVKYEVVGGMHWSHVNEIEVLSATVPDAGATLSLLGLAMFGLGAIRRKLR